MALRLAPGRRPERQRTQTQRIVTRAQRQILSELTPRQRGTLKGRGFTPRPQQVTVDPTKGAYGWPPPGPPVLSVVAGATEGGRTLVNVEPGGRPVRKGRHLLGEPLKPILRHEIGHQILGARGARSVIGEHHRLQEPRGTKAGLIRLGRLSTQQLTRLERRRRARPVSEISVPYPFGPRPELRGYQTEHHVKAAKEGSPGTKRRAREQMRRMGRRLRGRVDF